MKIISGHDQKSASHFYLSNCTFKLLSTRGYSCTTYLCTFLPPAELSPYRGFTVGSTLFQPITEILLKLSYSEREDAPEPEDATATNKPFPYVTPIHRLIFGACCAVHS